MKIKKASLLRRALPAFLILLIACRLQGQMLKSVVYDFDGFDLNATTLPEGEYSYGDLNYVVAANPLTASDIIGDRVIKLNINWNNGYAAFGRGISRFIEFDPVTDQFNFYFYNPSSNNQNATFDITIADDDNQNNTYETASDDSWKKSLSVGPNSGWQLISVPLNTFTDGNSGGNGVFDIVFTQNKGMLLLVEFRFNRLTPGLPNAQFYMDMICFSDGAMPQGNTALDLPAKSAQDYCPLGAFMPQTSGGHHLTPVQFEGLFPAGPGKTLKYVNTYLQWSQNSSTVPNAFPGASIQTLITNGYRPIITWEPMYLSLAPLDPGQPHLQDIIDGDFDQYIADFADVMVTYSDTVIIRFMHEFEGDWYPWCISQNGQDPTKFIAAWQKVVGIFKQQGATKVKWMWCGNSDYAPYEAYNWFVKAYPGNAYVDYVATDIYNGHYPLNLPWWRSFRWQATESCYYLTKYFPSKPLIICELGCRERISGDDVTSESKGEWYARMDKELQSNFRKVRGLIFFNTSTGSSQNWLVNSSTNSFTGIRDNIWNDNYYFTIPTIPTAALADLDNSSYISVYPNPSKETIFFTSKYFSSSEKIFVTVYSADGKLIVNRRAYNLNDSVMSFDIGGFQPGMYFVSLEPGTVESKALPQNLIKKIIIQ